MFNFLELFGYTQGECMKNNHKKDGALNMKWISQLIFFGLFLSICSKEAFASTGDVVYRWVDEHGKLHFSDLPKHKNAKIYDSHEELSSLQKKAELINKKKANLLAAIKKKKAEAAAKKKALLAQKEKAQQQIAKKKTEQNDGTMLAFSSFENCHSLKAKIREKRMDLISFDRHKVEFAQVFIEKASQVMAENGC